MKGKDIRVGDLHHDGSTVLNITHVGNQVWITWSDGKTNTRDLDMPSTGTSHTENSVPMFGELCMVKDVNNEWRERIFIAKRGSKFMCVCNKDAETFKHYDHVSTYTWDECKLIPATPMIELTVKINGIESKLSDISEETLLKLRETN